MNIIDSESEGHYSHENPKFFLTKSIELILCEYSDACILVTGNITATPNTAATQVISKNCAQFKIVEQILMILYADFVNISMHMYNLIEYSYNYSDTSGSRLMM